MAGISGIRFGGIASGLDTESIVRQLMQVERMKVDRYAQKKQTLEWKRDDYRDINTKLLALRNSALTCSYKALFWARRPLPQMKPYYRLLPTPMPWKVDSR